MKYDLSEKTYRTDQCAVFYRVAESFGEFANPCPGYDLELNGTRIPTTEHLYQAMRFPHLPDFQQAILDVEGGIPSKRFTYTRLSDTRRDWHEVNIEIMVFCVRLKMATYPDAFRASLKRVGDRPIVEMSRRDGFWGAKPGFDQAVLKGANLLGQICSEAGVWLMDKPEGEPIVVPAPGSGDMRFLGRSLEDVQVSPVRKKGPAQSGFLF